MRSLSQILSPVSFWAVLAFIPFAASASLEASTPNQVSTAQLLAAPMSFEANQGQTADAVRFLSRGPGYTFFLTPREAVLSLRSNGTESTRRGRRTAQHEMNQARLTMTFVGANPRPEVQGVDQLDGTANYFTGNDPSQWRTAVPTYGKVKYHDLYPGVDLIYYGNQRQVEYDFVIEPKADPRSIAISFSGADLLEIDEEGGLVAHLASGDIRWKQPFAYQESSGVKVEVPVKFVLKHRREVCFQIASYDTTKPLTIDPVLVYATYLGGNKGDFVAGIVVDASGSPYIIGDTTSPNFPTASAFRTTSVGSNEVFVTKLNTSGSGLIYSTYLGGSGNDYAGGIALDASGNAYLTGETDSSDFPTRNAAYPGNAGFNDAFVTKLGPFGTNLIYSTYLGGSGDDSGRAIAVDSGGNVYVTGATYSKGTGNGPFPTTQGAYQGNNGGGNTITSDAFVTKFNTNGVLSYSTFLGGSTDEKANGIAVDGSGNAYIVGEVASYPTFPTPPSSDFPLLNAFQSSFNRGNLDPLAGNTDGFLTKLNATGTGLIFSTFLGGNDEDTITGIALDSAGRVHVVGITSSTNFPTVNAAQPLNGGTINDPDFPGPDAFVSKFETNGASLLYSTYLGGSIDESPFLLDRFGVAVDKFGDIYIAGQTGSFDFPVTIGADQTISDAAVDAFIVKINPAVAGPASLIYSTLLSGSTGVLPGGADNEAGAIAVDNNGNFYVAGITSSTNFPVTAGAFRSSNGGGYDAFVAKFSSPADLSVTMTPSVEPVIIGSNVTYTIQVNNNGRSTFSGVTNFVQFTTNVRLGPISTTLGSFSTNNGLVTFNIGTLTNNASVTQTIVITNLLAGFYTNTATVTSTETPSLELNTDNNVAAVLSSVRGIADVTVSQSAAPNPGLITSNLIYTLTINNKGPSTATSLVLTDTLPLSVSFVSATNTQGTCSNVAGVVICDFVPLVNGTNARVTITTIALTNGVATNVANVAGFEADFSLANNSSTLLTTINPLADLSLAMTVSTNLVFVGNNVTFSLLITNQGPSSATGVVITNPLPAGATLVSTTTTQGNTNLTSGVVAFNLGTMASNGTATATITVKLNNPGSATNTATISSTTSDPDPSDNVASVTTTVELTPPQLAVSPATLNFGIVAVGANVQASFTLTNLGGASLSNGTATLDGGPFTILSGTPFNLPGFGSTNLVVRFAPTSAINFSNRVIFTSSNAGNSTNAVTGTGATVPAASFTASPTNGVKPLTVTFTDSSTGTITNRFWNFGDGRTTNTAATTFTHTYLNASTNTPSLTVTGPVGTNTLSLPNYITVTNPPPLLSLSPPNLNFGPVVLGQTNAQNFQVVNNGGLTLTGAAATTSPFGIQSGTPFNLAPGQTGLVVVTFAPTNAISFSNVVVFTSNGGNSTNTVTGSGLTPAQLAVLPASLDFGTVAVGSNAQASFTITNLGGATLSNGVATVSAGPFTIRSGTPFNLPSSGSTNLVIRFTPSSATNFTNVVTFTSSNAGSSTNPVTGIGAVVPVATFTASPTNGVKPLSVAFTDNSTGTITNRFWDFGDGTATNTTATSLTHTFLNASTNTVRLTVTGPVGTNTFSRTNYITVTNPSPLLSVSPPNLNFGPVVLGQTNTQNFQVVNNGGLTLTGAVATTLPFGIQSGTPFSLAPGQTGQVVVTFAPTNAISFSNVVVFTSNGGNSTNTVTGSGLKPAQLTVLPASLNFGTVAVGANAQASFTITNLGGVALSNGVATVDGGPFTILSGTPFNLPGSGSTNLVVRFTPSSAANFTNAVNFTSGNAGNSTNLVTGIGAVVPAATFTASPTNGVKPLTVTFTDSSTGTITNRFWTFGDGSTTNTTATSFAHTYLNASTNTPTLTVSGPVGTNTLARPNYITVTNPPPLMTLSPPNLDFGPVVLGQTNAQNFQIVNNGGLTLTGTAATTLPFGIRSGTPFSLAPGQTGTVVVTFAPANAINFSNVVVFTSNGGNSTNTVTGSGLTPGQLAVLPLSIDFGYVLVGANAQASFVITNSGGAALSNGTATVTSGPFTILSGTPFSLPGFASTNLVVRFAPTSGASFSNVVTVTAGTSANSINSVTGIGAVAPVAAFTASPTNGLKPLTVTFTDSSTGTITNRFWDFGDGSTTNTTATSFAHTYFNASTNTTTLTVTGPVGTNTLSRANYIVATNPPPLLTLSPPNLNFGPVVLGQTNTQNFQLVNNGGQTLAGAVVTTLPFAIQSGTPFSLAPGATGFVAVSFAPANAVSFSNVVVFTSNGGNSTNTVTGSGLTPGQLAVLPLAIDFGYVLVGANAQASFVITNSGGAALSNGTATVTSGPFTILSGTPFSLPGFSSTNLVVRFAPTSAASFSNVVTVTAGTSANSINSVTGIGAVVPVAAFTASPTNGLKPLTVTFTDSSTGTITNRFWDFGDGSTTNTTATSFAHTYFNASTNTTTLTVTGPVGTNTLSRANYIVATNPPPLLTLSPPNLNFGPVILGQTNTQNFQLVNNGGQTLAGAVVTTLPFAIQSGTPFSLAPGATGFVAVSFAPANAVSFSNVVVFTSNGGNSTNTVTGSGLTPGQLAVLPLAIDFGYVLVGANAQASFVITNSGGAPLSNGTATVTSGPFTILSGTPFSLPGFSSTNLVVRFAPTSAASFSNVVTVTAGTNANIINSVIGIGATVPLADFVATPTNGVSPLGVSFDDNSTGTITNRFWTFGDGATTNTTLSAVSHTYINSGTNTVTLLVSGPFGTSTQTRTNYITVVNPLLLISGIQLAGSDVVISFLSQSGQSYRLEYSDSLSGTWQTAVDLIPGNGTTVEVTHVGGAGKAARFYRIRRLP